MFVGPSVRCVACLADGMACSVHNVTEGLRRALPLLRCFLKAAGLAVHLSNPVLANYSRLSDVALHEVLRLLLGNRGVRLIGNMECLGILISPWSLVQ